MLILSACCTKVSCRSGYELRLSGFSENDFARACVIKGRDSFFIQIEKSMDSTYYYVKDFEASGNSPTIDYYFPVIDQRYVLTNFTYTKAKCNKCFLGSDYYEYFSGCKVNGVEQRSNIIILTK
jgi:hypothetical protein